MITELDILDDPGSSPGQVLDAPKTTAEETPGETADEAAEETAGKLEAGALEDEPE